MTEPTIEVQGGKRTPQEVIEQLRRANWRPAMEEIVDVLEEDHVQRFESDTSPEGVVWPKLSQYTIEKKGHDTKLEEFGFLRESLTDSGSPLAVRELTDNGDEKVIKFGTRRKWAKSHQYGTQRIPQRKHLGASQTAKQKIQGIIGAMVRRVVTGEE